MGVEYYLIRKDNWTAFELGKHTSTWREALAPYKELDGRYRVGPAMNEVRALAVRLKEHSTGWNWTFGEEDPTYFEEVARRIAAWSDGQPFSFAFEDDYWYAEPRPPRIKGSRYR